MLTDINLVLLQLRKFATDWRILFL